MKLTKAVIANLACPADKRDRLVSDDDQQGLFVRITKTQSKSFLAQFTVQGEKRRVPLGSCGAISLDQARAAARAIMGDVARGIDPAAERRIARAMARERDVRESYTLAAMIEDWRALHLVSRRPRYAAEAVRSIRNAFSNHLDAPAAEIDRALVVSILDRMARDGRAGAATHAATYAKALYGWAVKRGTILINPFVSLPVAPIRKRDRVLSDEEISAIWRATNEPTSFNQIVRALLLTGQRRDEVAAMVWSEISSDLSTWEIPGFRTKNGAPHVVPIAPAFAEMLRANPRTSGLVFPGERGVYSGWARSKAALDARSGATDWRLHDLRRTMATGMQRLGVRLEVTEAILNHLSGSRGGIIGVYQRHNWAEEKRAALEAWAAHVMHLVEGRGDGGNVFLLERAKG